MNGFTCGRWLWLFWLTLQPAPATIAATSLSATDDSGIRIELSRPAGRIVALSPHATELVFAAGAGERLVGVTAHSDFPSRAASLPRVGDAARLDRERLLTLAPDLVVAWPSGNRPRDLAWLERRGVPVFRSDPADLPAIADNLLAIGVLAGTTEPAQAAARRFELKLKQLSERFAARKPLDVFYQVWPRPLFTIGGEHLINRVLAVCGARNLFGELSQPAPQVSSEAVLARAPAAIVAAVESDNREDPFARWRPWRDLPAIRDQRFITISADLLHRAGPRILQGAEQLCLALEGVRGNG